MTNMTIRKTVHLKRYFQILVTALSIVPIAGCILWQAANHAEIIHRIEISPSEYKLNWVMEAISIIDSKIPLLVARSERLAFIGTVADSPYGVFLVDNTTKVEISVNCPSSVGIDEKFIYVGNCTGRLSSYDFSGKRMWIQSIKPTTEGDITQILTSVDSLIIYTEGGHMFRLSPSTGEFQEEYQLGCSTAVITQNMIYDLCGDGLEAKSIESGARVWMQYLEEPIYGLPVVIGNYLVLRTGSETGNLYAYNRLDGSPLWHTTAGNITGNPVGLNGLLYSLTTDSQLQGYAIDSGQLRTTITFAPPLTFSPIGSQKNSYYLASDQERVYAYLGDSLQLFCIQVLP
jgi:hypothetical protein